MTHSRDRLYDLLPAVYRGRDEEQGGPLRSLLRVIAEQVDVVEEDIERLYENWFIETCEDWVVPYIGDLVAYRPGYEAGDSSREAQRNKILIPRREVANTIRYRRRKGTLALLEMLAADAAAWPARAVEFYGLLGLAQPINHLRQERGRTVDLRHGAALDRLDGPFDELAHTVDVRRIRSHRTRGRYNIPTIGLFVWRLRSYPVTQTPAYYREDAGVHCYTFSVLGNDAPLYTRPEPEPDETHIAEESNVPAPIKRWALELRKTDFYGPDKSLEILVEDTRRPVSPDRIVTADLTDWVYRPRRGQVAVDPELGRIAFNPREVPDRVWSPTTTASQRTSAAASTLVLRPARPSTCCWTRGISKTRRPSGAGCSTHEILYPATCGKGSSKMGSARSKRRFLPIPSPSSRGP